MSGPSKDPGLFRHRLDLQNQAEVSDGCGGFVTTWQLVSQVWAAIEPVTSTQSSQLDTLNALTSNKITIRWRSDCTAGMRFIKSGREFLINSLHDPDETKRYLTCLCEEIK